MARLRQPSPAQRRRVAVQRRDRAFARLGGITAGIGIGAAAAVGVLSVYVSRALPGHHAPAAGGAVSGTGQSPSVSSGNSGSGNSGNTGSINPPSTPTQNSSAPAPVTSGAS